jgi:hypothetical protein
MATQPGGEILLYEAKDGAVRVEVRLERETVWLTQRQMAELFDTSTDNVGLHLKNIYADEELEELATAEDFSVVQIEGQRRVQRCLKHYNLDAIISVGYRVNSKRGTRFRQWATRTLREHLVRGYTINRQRFEHNAQELEAALILVRRAANGELLTTDQGRGLVDIIARYTQTFLLLQRYDEGLLVEPKGESGGVLPTIGEAMAAIWRLK